MKQTVLRKVKIFAKKIERFFHDLEKIIHLLCSTVISASIVVFFSTHAIHLTQTGVLSLFS